MKSFLIFHLFLTVFILMLLFSCSNDTQSPYSQEKSKVFLVLQGSTKISSDSSIIDTVGNTVRIGLYFYMPVYFDSALITLSRNALEIDTFFSCTKADFQKDTVWFEYKFKSAGVHIVNAVGYIQGGLRPSATGSITVIARPIVPVNHKPILLITGRKTITTAETCTMFVSATHEDTAQALAYKVLEGPGGYTFTNQIFTWKPATSADTGADTVMFTVTDNGTPPLSDTQKVTISVTKKNIILHALSQTISLKEDTSFTISLGVTSSDSLQVKTWQIIDSTKQGRLTGIGSTLIYSPKHDYNGSDTFTFRASDGSIWSDTGIIAIIVTSVNDAPIIMTNLDLTVQEGGTKTILSTALSAKDVDNAPSELTWTLMALPAHGAIKRSGASLIAGGTFTQKDIDSGIVSYTHNGTKTAADSIKLNLNDKDLLGDSGIVFHIKIGLVNDPPHAIGQAVSLKEDTSVAITINAIDPENQPIAAWQIIDTVKHGTMIGSANTYFYTPKPYYHGPDTFSFRAFDGTAWGDTAVVTITVVHVNHAPQWKQTTVNLAAKEGRTLDFDLSTMFDKDPDGDSVKYSLKSGVGSIKPDGKTWTWSPDFTAAAGSPAASVVTAKDNGTPNMSADIALSISVTDSICKLTLTAALGQGTFSTTPTGTAFDPGTEVQITAKPAADYIFKNWLGDIGNADSSKDSITISMNNQKNISAIFVKALETVTLNNDESFVHGSLYLNGYYYLSTRTSPAKILRLNANNLADYKVITFPDGYSSAEQLVYSQKTGKIYTIFYSSNSTTIIASFDPITMAFKENAIYDSLHDDRMGAGPTIATDGDYLYTTANVGNPVVSYTLLLKYSLTSMSSIPVDSLLLDSTCSNGHSMRYKDGMLYITGATTPPWIAKVRASDMSFIQKKDMPGGDIFTDDFAMTDSYIFGGLESDYHSSYSGTIFRISQNDITQIYGIATGTKGGSGLAGNCYGVQEAIGYIWAVFNTTPGTLTRIDPVSLQFKNYRLDYNSPNEIISDGKRLLITYWNLAPGVIQAFDPSHLEGREIP